MEESRIVISAVNYEPSYSENYFTPLNIYTFGIFK